jgi:hypothetical protein
MELPRGVLARDIDVWTVEPLVDRDGFLDGLVRDVVALAAP